MAELHAGRSELAVDLDAENLAAGDLNWPLIGSGIRPSALTAPSAERLLSRSSLVLRVLRRNVVGGLPAVRA